MCFSSDESIELGSSDQCLGAELLFTADDFVSSKIRRMTFKAKNDDRNFEKSLESRPIVNFFFLIFVLC